MYPIQAPHIPHLNHIPSYIRNMTNTTSLTTLTFYTIMNSYLNNPKYIKHHANIYSMSILLARNGDVYTSQSRTNNNTSTRPTQIISSKTKTTHYLGLNTTNNTLCAPNPPLWPIPQLSKLNKKLITPQTPTTMQQPFTIYEPHKLPRTPPSSIPTISFAFYTIHPLKSDPHKSIYTDSSFISPVDKGLGNITRLRVYK